MYSYLPIYVYDDNDNNNNYMIYVPILCSSWIVIQLPTISFFQGVCQVSLISQEMAAELPHSPLLTSISDGLGLIVFWCLKIRYPKIDQHVPDEN